MEQAGSKLQEGTSDILKGSTPSPVPDTTLPSLHTTSADCEGEDATWRCLWHCWQRPQQAGRWQPAWQGVPIPMSAVVRGSLPQDLDILKAPHFQELHLEVLLAERRVVEGLAVFRAPPQQVGIKGQSLASPSTDNDPLP